MQIPLTDQGQRATETAQPVVKLSTNQVSVAGYPGDRAHVLSLEENCKIISSFARGYVMHTSCIAIEGDSGGPILQKLDKGWYIVGLQAASTEQHKTRASIGVSALAFRHEFYNMLDLPTIEESAQNGEN